MAKRIDLYELYRTDPRKACRLALRRSKLAAKGHRVGITAHVSAQLGLYGIQVIRGEWRGGYWGDVIAEYANAGDSYACTVLYDVRTGRYVVTSYGDWVESKERNGRMVQ